MIKSKLALVSALLWVASVSVVPVDAKAVVVRGAPAVVRTAPNTITTPAVVGGHVAGRTIVAPRPVPTARRMR
jgi:hypothetical protein